MAGLAGKNMRFNLADTPGTPTTGTHVKVEDCNSNLETDWIDSSNSESGGFDEEVQGFSRGTVDIVIVAQIADTPYTAIGNGKQLAVSFYPDKGTAGSYLTGTLNVKSWQSRQAPKGKWAVHVTGKFQGAYTVTGL